MFSFLVVLGWRSESGVTAREGVQTPGMDITGSMSVMDASHVTFPYTSRMYSVVSPLGQLDYGSMMLCSHLVEPRANAEWGSANSALTAVCRGEVGFEDYDDKWRSA
ncbi:hypothetical protein IAQ61_002519 [Plenodomus lingam]|uniref:uncharacterized protein n=1 Tax=Leptosphaeria maculans TaxID=5022 RepID=UPI0033319C49|nr:hypothetical protein IAQ61_002519 [Plenodomus lingam]